MNAILDSKFIINIGIYCFDYFIKADNIKTNSLSGHYKQRNCDEISLNSDEFLKQYFLIHYFI